MSARSSNEKRYKQWTETDNGGRLYIRKVIGRYGWHALYIKEVSANEEVLNFRQEIYNDLNVLVEIHEKYPIDKGHKKISRT